MYNIFSLILANLPNFILTELCYLFFRPILKFLHKNAILINLTFRIILKILSSSTFYDIEWNNSFSSTISENNIHFHAGIANDEYRAIRTACTSHVLAKFVQADIFDHDIGNEENTGLVMWIILIYVYDLSSWCNSIRWSDFLKSV